MTLTKDQIIKRSAQVPDGWHYDWQFAAIHGKHTLTRRVDIDGTHFLTARISYTTERCATVCHTTDRYLPTLSVLRYEVRGDAVSSDNGTFLIIGDAKKNKNYKALCKYADGITEEMLMEIYNADRNLLDEGRPLFA